MIVSVIVPTFNRAKCISKAIESIIGQKCRELEVIIVDDHSKDNTEEIIRYYQKKNSNIYYQKNIFQKGPSGARNTGILKSSGDYIAFLDDDDIWLEDHLDKGVHFLEYNKDVNLVFGNFKVVDNRSGEHLYNFFEKKKILHQLNVKRYSDEYNLMQDDIFCALLKENFFHIGSAIIRKNAMHGMNFDEKITYAEDRDFAIRMYKENNAKFGCRMSPSFISYRHEDSLMSLSNRERGQKLLEAHLHLLKKYATKYPLNKKEKRVLNKETLNTLCNLSYFHRSNQNFRMSRIFLFESIKSGFDFRQIEELIKIVVSKIVAEFRTI